MAPEGDDDHAEEVGMYDEEEGGDYAGHGDDDESVLSFGDEDEEADGQRRYQTSTDSRPEPAGSGESAQPTPATQSQAVKPATKHKIEFPAAIAQTDSAQLPDAGVGSMSGDGQGKRRHGRSRGQGGTGMNMSMGMGVGNSGPPMPPSMHPNFGPMNGFGPMMGGMMPGMGMMGLGPPMHPPHPPFGPSLGQLSALGGPMHRPTPPPVPPPRPPPSWVPPPRPPASQQPQPPSLPPGSLPPGVGSTFGLPPNPALMMHALGALGGGGLRGSQAGVLPKKSVMLSMLEGASEAPPGMPSMEHLRQVAATNGAASGGVGMAPRSAAMARPAARASMAALLSKGSHAGYDVLKPQAPAVPQASVWVRPAAATQPQDDAANKPAVRKPTLPPSLPVLGEPASQPKATKWINPDIGKNHVSLAHGMSMPNVASAPPDKPAAAPTAAEVSAEELERKRLELVQKEADLKRKEEEQLQMIQQMQLQVLQQTLVHKFTQEAIEPAYKSRGRKRSRSHSRSRSRSHSPEYRERRRRSRSGEFHREEDYRNDDGDGYDRREVDDERQPFPKQRGHHEDRNDADEAWHDGRGGGERRSSEPRKRPASQTGYRDRADNHWDDADAPPVRDHFRGDDRRAPPRHASHSGDRERAEPRRDARVEEPRRDARGEEPRREGRFEARRDGRGDGAYEFGRDRAASRDAPREWDRPQLRREQGFSSDGTWGRQHDGRRAHAEHASEPPPPPPPPLRQLHQRRGDQGKALHHDAAARDWNEADRSRDGGRQPHHDRQRAVEQPRDHFRSPDSGNAKRAVKIEFPQQDGADLKPDVLRMREERFNLANKLQDAPAEMQEHGKNGGSRGGRRSGRRGPGGKGRR